MYRVPIVHLGPPGASAGQDLRDWIDLWLLANLLHARWFAHVLDRLVLHGLILGDVLRPALRFLRTILLQHLLEPGR